MQMRMYFTIPHFIRSVCQIFYESSVHSMRRKTRQQVTNYSQSVKKERPIMTLGGTKGSEVRPVIDIAVRSKGSSQEDNIYWPI